MKPEQRERLVELRHLMHEKAMNQPTMNEFHRLLGLAEELKDFLNCNPSDKTPEQWLLIAEEATKEVPDRFGNVENFGPRENFCKGVGITTHADGTKTTAYHHMSYAEIAAYKAAKEETNAE